MTLKTMIADDEPLARERLKMLLQRTRKSILLRSAEMATKS